MKKKDGECACFVDEYAAVCLNGDVYERTVRSSNCEMLVGTNASRCEHCKSYRNYLRTLSSRQLKKSSQALVERSSQFLSTPEKQVKMSKLKNKAKIAKKNLEAMKKKLDKLLEKHGGEVDAGLHDDLLMIMKEKNSGIEKSFPSDSFRRLLWEQQFIMHIILTAALGFKLKSMNNLSRNLKSINCQKINAIVP